MSDRPDENEEGVDDYLEATSPKEKDGLISSEEALPLVSLRAAFRVLKGTPGRGNTCVVLTVPSEDWIEPIARAATKCGDWGYVLTVAKHNPKEDHGKAVRWLADGRSVLCVSHAPERLLPRALLAVADLKLAIPAPDSKVIRKVLTLVTGKVCRAVPPGIVSGLDFPTICAAIRKGSSPRQCLDRLAAAARQGTREDPAMQSVPRLEALSGYGDAMTWCRRLAGDVELWRENRLDFKAIERMAVFESEPGLGKTTLVRSLSKTTGLPLFVSSVGKWFSESKGYLDDVIKEIDKLFNEAAKVGPSIVFLDELEGIPSRSTMSAKNASWWTPVVGHLLTTLDGAASGATSRLVVIGATNHADKLDPALVRNGRLSPVIFIERPDRQDLANIFRQHLDGDLVEADLEGIAAMASGASGADVVAWVKRARATARSEGRVILPSDLAEQMLPEIDLPPLVKRRIAIHEAGHAVVAQVLGVGQVTAVTMAGAGGVGGRTHIDIDNVLVTRESSEAIVMFTLGGTCAEEALMGSSSGGAGGSATSDLARATEIVGSNHASRGLGSGLAYRCAPDEVSRLLSLDRVLLSEVEKDLSRLRAATAVVVEAHRAPIAELAELLLLQRMVSGDAVRRIVEGHPTRAIGHG